MENLSMKGLGKGISSISRTYALASKCWAGFEDEIIPWLDTDVGKREAEKALRLIGNRFIMTQEHFINCDDIPRIPKGWELIRHDQCGKIKWETENVSFYVVPDLQENGKKIRGYGVRRMIEEMPVLNINAMRYLLRRQCLIPKKWRGKAIFFWGTIFRDHNHNLIVYYMFWEDKYKQWQESFAWFGAELDEDNPAILYKYAA